LGRNALSGLNRGWHYLFPSRVGMCPYAPHCHKGQKDGLGKKPTKSCTFHPRIHPSMAHVDVLQQCLYMWHHTRHHGCRIRTSNPEATGPPPHSSPMITGCSYSENGSFMSKLGSQFIYWDPRFKWTVRVTLVCDCVALLIYNKFNVFEVSWSLILHQSCKVVFLTLWILAANTIHYC
jgi:hypothetical protein